MSHDQHRAAGSIVDLVANRIGTGRAVHPETAVACAARLAGSLLLRSFGLKIDELAPGSVLLSAQANERGPQLVSILSSVIQNMGVTLDTSKLGGEVSMRGQAPALTFVESLDLLQDDAVRIATECGLGFEEGAHSAALATAFLVSECAKDIGSEVGFNVAVYSFIEGSKTVPPPLRQDVAPMKTKKRWYRPW